MRIYLLERKARAANQGGIGVKKGAGLRSRNYSTELASRMLLDITNNEVYTLIIYSTANMPTLTQKHIRTH